METFVDYTNGIKVDVAKTIANLNKANKIHNSSADKPSEVTTALLELYDVSIMGLIKMIEGQLTIINNLSERGDILQHEANIDAILKSLNAH